MLPPGDEVRRLKYYVKGQKLYASVVRIGRRNRILRLSARTADVAMRYGQAVLARYRRWCDIALAKEMEKVDGLTLSKPEWRMRYVERLLKRGIDPRFAAEVGNAAEVLLDIKPEDSADDEISTMQEDSR